MENKEDVICSFCGKNKRYRCVDYGYFTHICDRCIVQAYDILEVESSELSGLDQSVDY